MIGMYSKIEFQLDLSSSLRPSWLSKNREETSCRGLTVCVVVEIILILFFTSFHIHGVGWVTASAMPVVFAAGGAPFQIQSSLFHVFFWFLASIRSLLLLWWLLNLVWLPSRYSNWDLWSVGELILCDIFSQFRWGGLLDPPLLHCLEKGAQKAARSLS